ncbi:VOC family protein [Nocardia sp. NPDC051052]|uniref:VOC family protein n=1 Tax=Nocardia sp. NPDC051052 TaxID=3364322 RepID=UPI0037A19E85
MLSTQPVDALLLVTDLEVAREFYGRTLGLEVLFEDGEQFITFGCGGDSRLVVTKSSVGTKDEATKVSWRVDDIAAEVAGLRTRGVEILEFADLNTVDGIADVGFALAAWFEDPSKNSLGLLQLKGDAAH